MRITCAINLKGGVGKTTTIIHMAGILHRDAEKRLLLIDCDSQKNLTEFFEVSPADGNTAEVLRNPYASHAACCIQHTGFEGIDILAGSDELMDLDLSSINSQSVHPTVLRDMLALPQIREKYDYVLIDCPPAFNAAAAASLMAANDVVIPIKLDAFSLSGMGNMLRQIRNMRKINPKLLVAGVLPTMWYRSGLIISAEQQLRDSQLHVFPHIRRTPKVDELTFHRNIFADPRCANERDYRHFVRDYIEQEGERDGRI